MVKEGFVGFQFDKKYGGLGKDYMSYILTIEELGKVDASLCVLYSVSLSLFLGGILKYGTEEQKKFFIGGVADAAMAVTTEAIQLMGGEGYMKEFHVERMMRDAKITQIYEGTNEIQRMVIQGPIFR